MKSKKTDKNRISIEVKTACCKLDYSRSAKFMVYCQGQTFINALTKAHILSPSAMDLILEANPKLVKRVHGKPVNIQSFQWHTDNGEIVRPKSSKKLGLWFEEQLSYHVTVQEVLDFLGYDTSKFDMLLKKAYATKASDDDGNYGKAFEMAVKQLISPHSKYCHRVTPQGRIDAWLTANAQEIINMFGID